MEMSMFILILTLVISQCYSLENVALGKPATQSGTHVLQYFRWAAGHGVDGDTNPNHLKNTCTGADTKAADAPTRDKNGLAWWRVDLGQEFDVYQVKIYNMDLNPARLSKTWVLVTSTEEPIEATDETICHAIKNGEQDFVTVSCNYKNQLYKRGRYVTLWRQPGGVETHYVTVCEVQVFSCPAGTWGMNLPDGLADCVRKCPGSCQNGGSCRVSDGSCPSGCADGFWSRLCDHKCHCAGAAPCDIITGSCGAAECESPYITDKAGKCVTEEEKEDKEAVKLSQEETHSHTGLVAGMTVLGVLVLIIIVCLVVTAVLMVLLFKRSSNVSSDEETSSKAKKAPQSNPVVLPTAGNNQGFQREMDEYEELQQ